MSNKQHIPRSWWELFVTLVVIFIWRRLNSDIIDIVIISSLYIWNYFLWVIITTWLTRKSLSSYCQSSDFRANLQQMIMCSRVEIEELQAVPMSAVCLDCFIEKANLLFDLLNIWYSRLFDPLLLLKPDGLSISNLKV